MPSEPTLCHCGHPADRQWSSGPGRMNGHMCDCCCKKIWEETLANVTKALAELVVRCSND